MTVHHGAPHRLRQLTRLLALALIAPWGAAALGADGYRAITIADSRSGAGLPGAGWSVGNVSLNNAGVVAYSGFARPSPNELRTGVFIGDGSTFRTIAEGSRINNQPGDSYGVVAINNRNQVLFGYQSGVVSQDESRLWDNGAVSSFARRTPGIQYAPYALANAGIFSDQNTVALAAAGQLVVIGQGGGVVETAPRSILGQAGSASISSNGRFAISTGASSASAGSHTGLMITGRSEILLGTSAIAASPQPRIPQINNHGTGVFISNRAGGGAAGNLLGVVDARAPSGAFRPLLDTDDGFASFGASSAALAINNRNEIVFAARPANGATDDLNVYSVTTAGGAARPVLVRGDPIGTDGTTFERINPSSQNGFKINDRGQIAVLAAVRRGGQVFESIIRIDPEAGVSPGNPLLPPPGSEPAPPPPPSALPPTLPGGPVFALPGWRIPIPGTGGPRTPGRITWIDPEFAEGYVYTMSAGGPQIESIVVPAPLPGGDDEFTVHFDGLSFALKAGQQFRFTDHVPGGVLGFTIFGIDVAEQLDPDDPNAFITGLTFGASGTDEFSIAMNPLVAVVPEPAAALLMLLGMPLLAGPLRRRSKR